MAKNNYIEDPLNLQSQSGAGIHSVESFVKDIEFKNGFMPRQTIYNMVDTYLLENGDSIIFEIADLYLKKGNQFNPRNIDLTFCLLDKVSSETRDLILSNLVVNKSLFFEINQLKYMHSKISFLHKYYRHSPLLVSFLSEDMDKYYFFKNLGFSESIKVESIKINMCAKNDDEFVLYMDLKARPKEVGLMLKDVVKLRTPWFQFLNFMLKGGR